MDLLTILNNHSSTLHMFINIFFLLILTPDSPPSRPLYSSLESENLQAVMSDASSCTHNRTSVWIFSDYSREQMCNCQIGTDFPDTVLSLSASACFVQIQILLSSHVFHLICHGLFHAKDGCLANLWNVRSVALIESQNTGYRFHMYCKVLQIQVVYLEWGNRLYSYRQIF